jgi:hypothetical protein
VGYEYKGADPRFELPNPFRIENGCLLLIGVVFLVVGLLLILEVRGDFADTLHAVQSVQATVPRMAVVLPLAGALLSLAFAFIGVALTQLRLYFGRNRPQSLSHGYPPGVEAPLTPQAQELREHLRQQALPLKEPLGAVSSLLHSLMPSLILAPEPLRIAALTQFMNALRLLAMLISLLVGVLGSNDARVQQWLSVAFLLWGLAVLVRPLGRKRTLEQVQSALSPAQLILLLVGAILLPVAADAFAAHLPPLPISAPLTQVITLLVLGLCCYAGFFFAFTRQLYSRPAFSVASVQQTWTIRCDPAEVLNEFDRQMQLRWAEQVPNRIYGRQTPRVDLKQDSGRFTGEFLEETQPLPQAANPVSLEAVLGAPQWRPLLLIDCLATLCFAASAGAFLAFGYGLRSTEGIPYSTLIWALVFLGLGSYGLRTAHLLWSRFDYASRVIAVEMIGQFRTASVGIGGAWSDSLKSSSRLAQIEAMTFRVWMAELHTVTFGKDGSRYIVAMTGAPKEATQLATELRTFAEAQAALVAPVATGDAERAGQIANMNRLLGGGAAAARPALASPAQSAPLLSHPDVESTIILPQQTAGRRDVPKEANRFCTQCGAPTTSGALFCSSCGTRLAPAAA